MSARAVPLATLLSVVPYFHARGAVRVADDRPVARPLIHKRIAPPSA